MIGAPGLKEAGSLRIREFLAVVREAAEPLLPPERAPFYWRLRFNLLQLHHGDPSVHYEVWVQRKARRIELGLHFEGEREVNYRWAARLAERFVEIRARLDAPVELEEWTRSWTRLHELIAFDALDEALAEQVARWLADLVAVMEPILDQEGADS
jgi:hypothetical protein